MWCGKCDVVGVVWWMWCSRCSRCGGCGVVDEANRWSECGREWRMDRVVDTQNV